MASFLNKLAGVKDEDEKPEQIFAKNIKDNDEKEPVKKEKSDKDWLDENYEGQLSVDVYGTEDEIIVVSTIAGVKPENIDIAINNDMLTIRGERSQEKEENANDYYYEECYWGGFSRSIILPVEVEADQVQASLKNGVLTIRLPRSRKTKSISVQVKEE
jgi:HSP20 family protein